MADIDDLNLRAERRIAWQADLPEGVTPIAVLFGRDESGVGEVQVAIVAAGSRPTKQVLEGVHRARSSSTTMPVVVAAVHGALVTLFEAKHNALSGLSRTQAERLLQSILDEADGLAAQQQIDAIWRSADADGHLGYRNNFLFATYHLKEDVPRRPDWAEACERSCAIVDKSGRDLVDALGFSAEPATGRGDRALLLRATSGSRRAIAVLLDETEHFDQPSAHNRISPVAHGLQLAAQAEVPWVVVLRRTTLRLYPGRDGVGVGQRGQSDTFFELDLAMLDPALVGLLTLIFSAEALEKDGSADQILQGSARYAASLGNRLRERIYSDVMPPLAEAIARRLPPIGVDLDAQGLKLSYALAMRVMFRLLFVAYGEATGLLPAGRNGDYDRASLRGFAERAAQRSEDDYAGDAASIWHQVIALWQAVYHGNQAWAVPAYGGDLFDPRTEEGELIEKLDLSDAVVGPALRALLTDVTEDGVRGPVDFRSLQVREFGTIYEGLLECSVSLAETDLTLETSGAFRPARQGEPIEVEAGEPYFHTTSGDRKATGSYYTPKVIVDHLIERSVQPALARHLARVKALVDEGKDRAAADLFWDFRVGDLAMGSGHFLIAAIDKIEQGMRDFLATCSLPAIEAELERLAGRARDALGEDVEAAQQINNAQLLRRQIARRCIYGLDINPLAVELARLAVWIHTFVPGLPMSTLSHGLVLGNSLTGIGTVDEALDALEPKRKPGQGTFFDDIIQSELARARDRLLDYAAADEASKAEVEHSGELLAAARDASATARRIFDAAVAVRAGDVPQRAIISDAGLEELVSHPKVAEVTAKLQPAHMPVLFPEVFLRDNPGFDVLVGNPPWEKLHVEEHQWWGLRFPGLRSLPAKERDARLAEIRAERPDLVAEYEADVRETAAVNKAVASGPYPGLGAAHLDLYQAFAWRFWALLRQCGRAANVLPRGALSGSALAAWRRDVLTSGAFEDVCIITNNRQWAFEQVDPRYTVGLVVIARSGEPVVRVAGPFFSEDELRAGRLSLSEMPADEFLAWSSTAAFPLLPDPMSTEVFSRMKQSPRFDEVRADWDFRPVQGDFNATGDKDKFEFDIDEPRGRVPVLAGASFNLWEPDFGSPYAYARPEVIRPALADKLARATRNARSAYYGMTFAQGELPMDRPRIAFRDVTNQTNSRTTVVALLPPGAATVHNAPVLVNRRANGRPEAYLLGVMSSIPFDWVSRRWVELHLTFEVLSLLPVPRWTPGSAWTEQVIELAGRLAAVDGRYREWADEVGVPVGSVTSEAEKEDLVAELDALVSLLYGLERDHVEHVFATFHRGWDYEERLAAALRHYDRWKSA